MRMVTTPVALVTGSGAKRIGWHVAEALAARGYALALHYRTSAEEAQQSVAHLRQRGTHAIAVQADLADESAVANLMNAVLDPAVLADDDMQRASQLPVGIQRRS